MGVRVRCIRENCRRRREGAFLTQVNIIILMEKKQNMRMNQITTKMKELEIMVVEERVGCCGNLNVHLIISRGFSRHVCNCVVVKVIVKFFGSGVVKGVRSFISGRRSGLYILLVAVVWIMFWCVFLAMFASEKVAIRRIMSYHITVIAFGLGHVRRIFGGWGRGRRR
jgi:hypothetical protein